jgi:hypothetical protein
MVYFYIHAAHSSGKIDCARFLLYLDEGPFFPAVYFKQMVLQMVQTSIWNVEGGGTQAPCIWRSRRCGVTGSFSGNRVGGGEKPRLVRCRRLLPWGFHCNSTAIPCHGPQDSPRLGIHGC